MVSASGDASVRLIRGGDVAADEPEADPGLQRTSSTRSSRRRTTPSTACTTASRCSGARTCCSTARTKVKPAPTSWSALYDPKYKGQITIPDNSIQIADAALYLSKTKPDLGITDPYELNEEQFDATVNLLKQQRTLLKKCWALASDEIDLFKNGDASLGASGRTRRTRSRRTRSRSRTDPEGRHDRVGRHVDALVQVGAPELRLPVDEVRLTPQVQAQQAIWFGETPANPKACPYGPTEPGLLHEYHADHRRRTSTASSSGRPRSRTAERQGRTA